jgi:hypothetical protein
MDKSLLLDDGTNLPWLRKSAEFYLNKTTLIYGQTDSGKSTIIDEILFLCKDVISFPFVICPTSQSNSFYSSRIPESCIKLNLDKAWIEKFAKQQSNRARIYNTANSMKNLESLFNKTPNNKRAKTVEDTIRTSGTQYHRDIDNSTTMTFIQKREQKKEINKSMAKKLVELYKTHIRLHKVVLEKRDDLTKDEQCSLKYLDFRPHCLLIFDDCAAVFKKWVKESPTIKTLFYAGRHDYITFIITTQDDKEIDSELRKNSKVSIFTTEQAAISNYDRPSNSYPKHIKARAILSAKKIFEQDGTRNFRKLVHLSGVSGDPFYYTVADLYDEFHVGAPSVWELDQKIKEKKPGHAHSDTDAFFDKYYNM